MTLFCPFQGFSISSLVIMDRVPRGKPFANKSFIVRTKYLDSTAIMAYRAGSESLGSGMSLTGHRGLSKKCSIWDRSPSIYPIIKHSYMRYNDEVGVSPLVNGFFLHRCFRCIKSHATSGVRKSFALCFDCHRKNAEIFEMISEEVVASKILT